MASGRAVRLPVTLAAMAVIAAIAGCTTAPSGGPPRRATGNGSQVQAYVQLLPPPPPTNKWQPDEVVLGFLHASASYAFDPAAAERYLAPALRKRWHPENGAVAVVGSTPLPVPGPALNKPQTEGNSPGQIVTLKVEQLATLSQTGQYASGQNLEDKFLLAKINGVWLIDGLPATQPGLLLTQSDFELVYQARNLFFHAPPQPWAPYGVLVPDPVYAPLQSENSALNTNLATRLVRGLLQGPRDWLSGTASSEFPVGTRLIGQVTITGRVAKVHLGGTAARASSLQKALMVAQLRATLGDRSYSAPLATQVQMYVNNTLFTEWPAVANTPLITPMSTGPVLAVTGPSSVGQLQSEASRPDDPRANATPSARVNPAQIGRAAITAIAAEPTSAVPLPENLQHGRMPAIAVAVQDQNGCAVVLTTDSHALSHPHVLSTSGGPCTSLSWDNNGNLWAAAGQAAWVLPPQSRRPIAVDVSALTATGQSGRTQIVALRMAPDSLRAALLVHTKSGGNKLLLAAARVGRNAAAFGPPVSIGAPPNGPDPIAISWEDAYHLAVLANGVIFAVPLTGGAGIQQGGSPLTLGAAPSGAQTLTTDGSELVVGAADNGGAGTAVSRLFAASWGSQRWTQVALGSDPVYPG